MDDATILKLLRGAESTNGDTPHSEALDGATFLLDQDASLTPRWGIGSEVLWAVGESLFIVGPPGVGKSTLAHQIIAGLIGISGELLGYPILPARKVLYLALDRPSQIRRAMRRLFGEQHRGVLKERLVVWPRPLASDLGKNPDLLREMAEKAGADVVIIDSVKDTVAKLTGDEEANGFNKALQACLADGIDVLALHHQRKGQGGTKPTSLEDVYGSIWLVAGAGSVLLLWGEAGSELVELTHLKQPADPVGPLKLEHDHYVASTVVSEQWDPLAYLKMRGAGGATLAEAAQAEHGTADVPDAKRKKTERKLRGLERRGLVRHEGGKDGQKGSDGRIQSTRWWASDPLEPWTNPLDTPSYPQGMDVSMDTMDTF